MSTSSGSGTTVALPVAVDGAIRPWDILAPGGEIDPALFAEGDAGGNTETRVIAAIAEATGLAAIAALGDAAAQASAIRPWVYARIWQAKADQLAQVAASVNVDGISRTYTAEQINHYRRRASRAYNDYLRATGESPRGAMASRGATLSVGF